MNYSKHGARDDESAQDGPDHDDEAGDDKHAMTTLIYGRVWMVSCLARYDLMARIAAA